MDQLRISAREAKTKPNYRTHAAELLNWCREFYQDPENEKAYQEWKNDTSKFIQRNRRTGSGGGDGGIYNRRTV